MGWDIEDVGLGNITLRLDSHGGEKERRHQELAKELDLKLRKAVLEVLRDPKYAEILLYSPEYYVGTE